MPFIETVHAQEEEQGITTQTTEYISETPARETGQDEGLLASLGLNGPLFAAQLFNFALVACILWFLILKPLTKKLTERQKMIDDSIENSKKIQQNLEKSEQKYQEKIDEAKVAANKVIENAASEAEKTGNLLKTKAKQEIEILVEQAKKNIRSEREDMKAMIKQEAAELVTLALEKILSEKMNDKKDKELIAEMLKKI